MGTKKVILTEETTLVEGAGKKKDIEGRCNRLELKLKKLLLIR